MLLPVKDNRSIAALLSRISSGGLRNPLSQLSIYISVRNLSLRGSTIALGLGYNSVNKGLSSESCGLRTWRPPPPLPQLPTRPSILFTCTEIAPLHLPHLRAIYYYTKRQNLYFPLRWGVGEKPETGRNFDPPLIAAHKLHLYAYTYNILKVFDKFLWAGANTSFALIVRI